MIKFSEYLLEINLSTINKVEPTLLWKGLKHHLSDIDNFKAMLNSKDTYNQPDKRVRMQDIGFNPMSTVRNKNLHVRFDHKTDDIGSYTQEGYKDQQPKDINHIISLHGFHSLHPMNLENEDIENVHKHFLRELKSKQSTFVHEHSHYVDFQNTNHFQNTNNVIHPETHGYEAYINSPDELKAWTLQKKHEITRALLRNHPSFAGEKGVGELPLRERLSKMHPGESFENILKTINNHTIDNLHTSHNEWYGRLSVKNRKYVRDELKPLIDKYAGK